MDTLSMKEARQGFRHILDRVEKGEEIAITRRGKAVARIVPIEKGGKKLPALDKFRDSIGERGSSSVELLREEREER